MFFKSLADILRRKKGFPFDFRLNLPKDGQINTYALGTCFKLHGVIDGSPFLFLGLSFFMWKRKPNTPEVTKLGKAGQAAVEEE